MSKHVPLAVHSFRQPGTWFVPTHLYFAPHSSVKSDHPTVSWQSRRARKGRYAAKLSEVQNGKHNSVSVSARTGSADTRLKLRLYPDISFWIAFVFTFGSAIWVVNGKSMRD